MPLFHEKPNPFYDYATHMHLNIRKIGKSYIILSHRGHLYTLGPHWPGVVVTIAIIIGGTWLNLKVVKQNDFSLYWDTCIRLLIAALFTATLGFLLLTALVDPGMVASNPVADDISEEAMINLSYCDYCECYQPHELHIRHCHDCDMCIIGHDHHCPWMGKCIGRNNMKWFILFNISWMIYVTELMIMAWVF